MIVLYLVLEGHTWRTVLLSALHSNKDVKPPGRNPEESKENKQGARKFAELQKCWWKLKD